jgi:antitoxin (DNA-binding transcriptional repressor) of toxin-antitoxin stability system
MHHVPITEVSKRLTELASAVEAGETIVVTRDGRPILDLVPHKARAGLNLEAIDSFKKELGIERFVASIPENFDEPLPEEILLGDHPAWR